ncbi:MAG TPA: sugar phosphate isomerase/epimerase family protein [Pirellulales bacterium]|jgi:sugar phosphate isomerase/epimerase|nr:sugar phosphate isomerase/epimerase family protein [Pirellulales bacterium]
MARLSMNEMTTFRWSLDEDIAHYRAAGIGAIGIWRQKLADFGEEKGLELLAESGLKVSNLLWAGGFTGSDGRSLKDSIEDALDAVRLAAELQASALVVYSGSRAGHTHSHARRLVKDALGKMLQLADELDVTLALEPMHSDCAGEWTFLTCLDDTLALLESVAHPRLKLAFDTYHLGWDPKTLARIPELAPRVGIVHLGDGRRPRDREQDRSPLGCGAIPLREIVSSLRAAGYDGYYDVELIGPEIETADYHDLLRRSKETFEQLIAP